jgi:acetyl esterase/lipase
MAEKPHYAFPHVIPDAKTEHITRKMYDLAYASVSPAQKLDIYWPAEGNGPFPVIIAIHGGAFMGGDKRDVQLTPMLEGLKRGYAVVSVNYRMSGEAIFPALVHDLKAAIRWIRANAEAFLFDPDRIATWGGSAGGYLSLMAGVSSGVIELASPELGNSDRSDNVQAVVAWFPPTDFATMDDELSHSGFIIPAEFSHNGENSPESLLLGNKITDSPELVRIANPATYIHPGLPHFFIQHGTQDTTVPYQQSMRFAAKLDAVSPHTVTYELLLNARHADPAFETPRNVQKVLDFLDKSFHL